MKKLPKKPTTHCEPEYPSLRSTTFDRRKFLSLLGGGAAASALYTTVVGFEEPLFAQMPENELLTSVDIKLASTFDVDDFKSQDALEQIEKTARHAMVEAFESEYETSPSLNRVEFVVQRVLRPDDPIGIIKTRVSF